MDWHEIKETLCAAREWTPVQDGYRVLSDTLMPSGGLIYVYIQMRGGHLFMHDDGAAFDEIARMGAEMSTASGVRRLLSETNFRLTPKGEICRDGIAPTDVAVGISLVADASLRAATFMLARAKVRIGQPLDSRVKAALRQRFPGGTADFRFDGKAKQQKFDFGMEVDGETILVDAVSPDISSVNSAIVKSLDAKSAPNSRARPILVYDERDRWHADAMNLLGMAGERMEFKRVAEGLLKAA